MSAVSLEARIRTAASQDAALVSLLTAGASFRWCCNGWLIQGLLPITPGAKPVVVTQLISNNAMYVAGGRIPTSWARVQFLIYGGQYTAGAQAAEDVGAALKAFLDTLHLSTTNPDVAQANYVTNERAMLFPHTDSPIYQKVIDGMIWSDDSIS